ncbi:hypothetical protein BJ508DRAFT_332540 [Ascobolus immersus RN42]|uniref:Uncharacterized protein n=1 Tax=Ascobolus immersus RN42 TaxID=1160509 RepID=A0A3N4HR47_ASCIM|nr:hypothetical protein BJ508DRAFT_332540 [Ascobolus immersus RN42]
MLPLLLELFTTTLSPVSFNARVLTLPIRKYALSTLILSHRDRLRSLGFIISDSDEVTHTFTSSPSSGVSDHVEKLIFYRQLLDIKIRDTDLPLFSERGVVRAVLSLRSEELVLDLLEEASRDEESRIRMLERIGARMMRDAWASEQEKRRMEGGAEEVEEGVYGG